MDVTLQSQDPETTSTVSQTRGPRPAWGLSLCIPRPRKKAKSSIVARSPPSRSLKGTLARLFGIKLRARPQPQSGFFSRLPLELRHEIYAYVFASSMIHERTRDLLSSWDHLLLSCRQAKAEMESMPAQPIVAAVQAHWLVKFPNNPLNVRFTVKEGRVDELIIGVPRTVLQYQYRHQIRRYIPDYISPLFRIFADSLTLTIYDDGSPLIDVRRVHVNYHIFSQILSTVWARERKLLLLGKKYFTHPLPLPTSRNYFNSKKVVVDWQGSLTGMEEEHIGLYYWLHVQWLLSKPFRMRLHLGKRRFVMEWIDKKHFTIQSVSWESRTRFRK